ncbi:hypothetical protein [Streptacidiphilus anmyonensis]|uniref:hypothetical protein n=1 Tax=Streptacidiphilus anmyonensis TaxID=405782 RepID=UPI0005A9064E|nr:hypothetical protein [Streptacidiphilus anmyonensis]
MPDDIATALLDLVSQAENLTEPTGLRRLLAQAHPLWCHALEDVRTHTRTQAADWTDAQLVERATAEGIHVAPGSSREELLQDLVFQRFDATPAALAYQALAERAHAHHAGLVD